MSDVDVRELFIEIESQKAWFKNHLDTLRREGKDTNYAAGSFDAYVWILNTWDEITRSDYAE